MKSRILAAAMLTIAAGTANAAIISFASSTSDTSWTFTGNGGAVTDATGPTDFLTLHIDDDNGPLPVISVSTQFNSQYNLAYVGSLPLGGGDFSHNYLGSGSFSFQDVASGVTILTVNFSNALFTARGGQASWYTTAALQGDNNGGATVSYTWNGPALPAYNLIPGTSPGDFAFDLAVLNSSGAIPYAGQAPGRALGANSLPSGQWWSEASYTGFTQIPAPGSLTLLALAGLVAARRRR
jgi:uncharacterized protein (TIGR03382 family)